MNLWSPGTLLVQGARYRSGPSRCCGPGRDKGVLTTPGDIQAARELAKQALQHPR